MSVQLPLNDQRIVCRTCLKVLSDNTGFTYLDDDSGYIKNVGNIREMLQFCLPELDLYVSSKPVICYHCLPILVQVYNFKIKCLNGESAIRAYIVRNNLQEYNHVNLNCVLMDEVRIKNQKTQIENRIKHYMLQETSVSNNVDLSKNVIVHHQKSHEVANQHEKIDQENFEGIEEQSETTESAQKNDCLDQETIEHHVKIEVEDSEQLDVNYNSQEDKDNESEINNIDTDGRSNGHLMNDDNATEKQKNMVVVRKDLFDNNSAKQGKKQKSNLVLNNGIVSKNGRIIIRIDRKRLQNFANINTGGSKCDVSFKLNSISQNSNIVVKPPPLTPIFTSEVTTSTKENPESNTQNTNDGSPVYNCNKCSYITQDIIKIYDHNRTFHNFDYTCQHCPFSTSKVELLGKHMTMVHPKEMVSQRSFKVSENYACTLCPFSVKNIDLLRSHHLSAHSNQNADSERDGPIILNNAFRDDGGHEPKILKRTEYSCDVCNYSTKDKSNLRKHLFTHGTKPLKCDFCFYKCVSPYQLRRHVKQKHAKNCDLKSRSAPYPLPTYDDPDQFKITLATLKKELEN